MTQVILQAMQMAWQEWLTRWVFSSSVSENYIHVLQNCYWLRSTAFWFTSSKFHHNMWWQEATIVELPVDNRSKSYK